MMVVMVAVVLVVLLVLLPVRPAMTMAVMVPVHQTPLERLARPRPTLLT